MSKLVLISLLGLLLLGACGEYNVEDYYAELEEVEIEDIYEEEEQVLPSATMSQSVLVTEQYREDLDYMLYVLQNNFALFDVAYWARGVDIYAIIDNIREAVLANPDMIL